MPQSLTVSITTAVEKGIIVVKDGRVIHARSSQFKGKKALFELLRLQQGKFSLEPTATTFQHTIKTKWEKLLKQCDAVIDKATTKENPLELGVEPSLGLKPNGEMSEIDPVFRKVPGIILAAEISEEGEVLDRSGLGNASAAKRMASFMMRVATDLSTILDQGGPSKVSIKGDDILFVQQGTGNSLIAAFFNAKWSPGRAYRSIDRSVIELKELRTNHLNEKSN